MNVGHVVRQTSPVKQIVPAERAVVEAYGKIEATVDVEVKFEARTFPAMIADDEAKN